MSNSRVTDVVQSTPVHWHCDIMQSTRCDSGCQQCVDSEECACMCHVGEGIVQVYTNIYML